MNLKIEAYRLKLNLLNFEISGENKYYSIVNVTISRIFVV